VVDKQNKLIVLLPPKTASNSIQNYLYNLGYGWSTPSIKLNFPEIHLTLKEYCLSFSIDPADLNNYDIIQITRNPINRFISSFYHQQRLLKCELDIEFLLDKLEECIHLIPNDPKDFYKVFYDQKLDWINSISNPNKTPYQDSCYSWGNWGGLRFYYPQSFWNDLNQNVKYFKLEDIINKKSNFNIFKAKLPWGHIDSFPDHHKDSIPHLNAASPYNKNFSLSIKNRIYNLFTLDFKLFDYEL